MSKKTRNLTNKPGKLMKCDGYMLKKVIEAKGYKCHELSKMLRYCSDYLTTCCRTNKISDVAAKYLMDYKIFPQMYDLEGEIKVEEPKEVKIDKDEKKDVESDKKAADDLKKRMDMNIRNSTYGIPKPDKGINGIDYTYGPGFKHPNYFSYYAAGQDIARGMFKMMQAAMNDLKHDREFKELIKQAVKEAYEEL